MDNTEKFLRKLPLDKRQVVKSVLVKILSGETNGLDIKKLKGYKNLFRVRVGDIRIVFSQEEGHLDVLFVGRRGDSKYEQF